MKMPGFTAEASLAALGTHYCMIATSRTSFTRANGGVVMPQAWARDGRVCVGKCCCPPGKLPVGGPCVAAHLITRKSRRTRWTRERSP